MANICYFKGIIKGKENNSEKFLEIFPCYDIIERKDYGSDELNNYAVVFCGSSPYGICPYSKENNDVSKLTEEVLDNISDDDINEYEKYTLKDLSILFDLDILINSMDEEYSECYYHYNKGEKINDKALSILKITKEELDNEKITLKEINLDKIFGCNNAKPIKFVITGDLKQFANRDELVKVIEEMNNGVSSSVSKNTNYLICNDKNSNSSKLNKARELGIEIISEEEFINKFMNAKINKEASVISDKAKAIKLINKKTKNIELLSDSLKNDIDIINLLFTKIDGFYYYGCIGTKLLNDKDFILHAINVADGRILKYASDDLKDDEEVVLAAVTKSGNVLKYASERLRKNENIALHSVKEYFELPPVDYMDSTLLEKKDFILQLVKEDSFTLYCLEEKWTKDKDVVLTALKSDNKSDEMTSLEFADESLLNDKDFMLEAVKINKKNKEYINKTLKKDVEFMNKIKRIR